MHRFLPLCILIENLWCSNFKKCFVQGFSFCTVNTFIRWLYYVKWQSTSCSSHVFTNPEFSIFVQEVLFVLFFYDLEVFDWDHIKLTWKMPMFILSKKGNLKPFQKTFWDLKFVKWVSFSSHFWFSFFVVCQNDEKRKNQLYCVCLKMTADFGNFVAKTDKKRKTKDEMKRAEIVEFYKLDV